MSQFNIYTRSAKPFVSRLTGSTAGRASLRAGLWALLLGATCSTVASNAIGAAPASDNVIPQAPSAVGPIGAPISRVRRLLQFGQASWYGLGFQGRKTATGEKFDMNSLTCAHRSLPLGSWVRVTNLSNRKTVFVRVNDRGPMVGRRIVDLSYAAARAVGLAGVGKVKLEAVTPSDPQIARDLLAQIGSLDLGQPIFAGIR